MSNKLTQYYGNKDIYQELKFQCSKFFSMTLYEIPKVSSCYPLFIPPLSPKQAVPLLFFAHSIELTIEVRPYSALREFHLS